MTLLKPKDVNTLNDKPITNLNFVQKGGMYGYDPGANIILRYSVMTVFVASSVFLHLTGSVCTVKSSAGKEVILGSNFTISCTFKKGCTKEIFWNKQPIRYKQFNNSIVVSVKNLTEFSTFACKCKEAHDPDPCGIDITPGCKLVTFYNVFLFQGSHTHARSRCIFQVTLSSEIS